MLNQYQSPVKMPNSSVAPVADPQETVYIFRQQQDTAGRELVCSQEKKQNNKDTKIIHVTYTTVTSNNA